MPLVTQKTLRFYSFVLPLTLCPLTFSPRRHLPQASCKPRTLAGASPPRTARVTARADTYRAARPCVCLLQLPPPHRPPPHQHVRCSCWSASHRRRVRLPSARRNYWSTTPRRRVHLPRPDAAPIRLPQTMQLSQPPPTKGMMVKSPQNLFSEATPYDLAKHIHTQLQLHHRVALEQSFESGAALLWSIVMPDTPSLEGQEKSFYHHSLTPNMSL